MAGESRVMFERCREEAQASRGHVRVLLETTGPTVSRIPWEFTVDPRITDDYLALRSSFARCLRVAAPIAPLNVRSPLRVLGIRAKPQDLPQLDYEVERQRMQEAFDTVGSDAVQVTWLAGDRWRDISDALRSESWHVLHFVGHGGFDVELDSGYLQLSDDEGNAIEVPAREIGRALSRSRDLRLVVLNACESATSGSSGASSSTAAKLMGEGIPAVVAMQYEITDPAAIAFSAAFYESIARGAPIDQAMSCAREIVKVSLKSLEWATPVLFLASDETRIFEVTPSLSPKRGSTPRDSKSDRAPLPHSQPNSPLPQPVSHANAASGQRDWMNAFRGKLDTLLDNSKDYLQRDSRGTTEVGHNDRQQLVCVDQSALLPSHAAVLGSGQLALACDDGSVRTWSTVTRQWTSRCFHPRGARPVLLASSPWRRHIASAHDDGSVVVWNTETASALRMVWPEGRRVDALTFSHDGKWLTVLSTDEVIRFFDSNGVVRRQVPIGGQPSPILARVSRRQPGSHLRFIDGGRSIVASSSDGIVRKFNAHQQFPTAWPNPGPLIALATSTGRLATCTSNGTLSVWDWAGRLLNRVNGSPAEHMEFSPDGAILAMAARDRTLSIWSHDGDQIAAVKLANAPVGIGFVDTAVLTATTAGAEWWSVNV